MPLIQRNGLSATPQNFNLKKDKKIIFVRVTTNE